jgi:hypothetical protein
MSYAELARALGVSVDGARRRVQRGRWARQTGNDGRARVLVPEGVELERRPDSAPNDTPNVAPDNPVHAQIARLEAELAGLRETLAEARGRAGAAEEHIESLRAQLSAAQARADAEAAKTAHAIRAFESLAERLEAIAEAQKAKTLRHWWRRIIRQG